MRASTAPRVEITESTLQHAVDVLRLLADGTRLAILATLRDGAEKSVSALAEELDRPTPAVSQHLAKLRAGHLVTSRRAGTTVFYSLSSQHVELLVTNALQHSEHMQFDVPPHHR
ncbi:ArsR/SmtB family transcription factor [Pengzhenrongella frigida]|uniref:ArsR family transcriptional regulator n=1 Tax=Pengzhenrongella frigida TaxID=1259133 RepID=A0A4Q5MX88_9MICO|nr:metalloregulator ArsR/SmtB family transcription factor [Cellulomonas sp. HLT2-17]RYV49553.1 ArsR family transcriptional regulator [Cellulomonas sp. HLT2-17]